MIKGFDAPRTQTYLRRDACKFLVSLGVGNGVADPRSVEWVVKVTFRIERTVGEALEKIRT